MIYLLCGYLLGDIGGSEVKEEIKRIAKFYNIPLQSSRSFTSDSRQISDFISKINDNSAGYQELLPELYNLIKTQIKSNASK